MNTYTNESMTQKNSSAGSFLTGVLFGGLAGAIAGLFLAPQSGKDTRQQIQQKAVDLRNQATTTVEKTITDLRSKADQLKIEVEEKAQSLKHQGQDVLVHQLDRVSEAVESSKKKLIQGNGNSR